MSSQFAPSNPISPNIVPSVLPPVDVGDRTFPDEAPAKPLRVMFLITSLYVGGAETLLVNMMRQFDRRRIVPLVGCLKEPGPLGMEIAADFRSFSNLIGHKFDVAVLGRLKRLMQQEQIDAVVTVGAGDKMFWGRLAARRARVPVIVSALHSTGWPDGISRLNRLLTPITDAFIAVAAPHRDHLIHVERFPESKVHMIPNGIDCRRFVFDPGRRAAWRQQLDIPADSPVVGIVAALRPEKNHELFLRVAERVSGSIARTHFLIVGDGPRRQALEQMAAGLNCCQHIHFVGNSTDIPGALSAMDVFSLTSHNEANPVSILEAMSASRAVVAPQVGSIDESVVHGKTGLLARAGDERQFAAQWAQLLEDADLRADFGSAGRRHVQQHGSLAAMTRGYTSLIEQLFREKTSPRAGVSRGTP